MASQKLTITAEFLASVKGMDEVVAKMKKGLDEAGTDFSKNKILSNTLKRFSTEYSKFISMTKDGTVDLLDSKKVLRSGKAILDIFRQIQSEIGDLSDLSMDTAKRLFPDSFKANISAANNQIESFVKNFGKFKQARTNIKELEQETGKLKTALEKTRTARVSDDFTADIAAQGEEIKKVTAQMDRLKKKMAGTLGENSNAKAAHDFRRATKEIIKDTEKLNEARKRQEKLGEVNIGEHTYGKIGSEVKNAEKVLDKAKAERDNFISEKVKSTDDTIASTTEKLKKLEKIKTFFDATQQAEKYKKELDEIDKKLNNIENKKELNKARKALEDSEKIEGAENFTLKDVNRRMSTVNRGIADYTSKIAGINSNEQRTEKDTNRRADYKKQIQALTREKKYLEDVKVYLEKKAEVTKFEELLKGTNIDAIDTSVTAKMDLTRQKKSREEKIVGYQKTALETGVNTKQLKGMTAESLPEEMAAVKNILKKAKVDKEKFDVKRDTLEISDEDYVNNLKRLNQEIEEAEQKLKELGKIQAFLETNNEVKTLEASLKNTKKELDEINTEILKLVEEHLVNSDLGEFAPEDIKAFQELMTRRQAALEEQERLKLEKKSAPTMKQRDAQVKKDEDAYLKKEKELEKQREEIKKLEKEINIVEITNSLKKAGVDVSSLKDITNLDDFVSKLKELKLNLANLDQTSLDKLKEQLKSVGISSEDVQEIVQKMTQNMEDFGGSADDANRVNEEIEQLKNNVAYFFGITNTLNIFKDAIRSAFNTVKELDKIMAETAVVTDFSVSDMWKQLPEYTRRANELGVATKEAYSAATLYYQQGNHENLTFFLKCDIMFM